VQSNDARRAANPFTVVPHQLHLTYFAILREQRGASSETLSTSAATARALYEELRAKYHFTLPLDRVRVALDDAFAQWDAPLKDGQKIAFIPPVAGG
jgi:molybdopterin converting factor subunit 1